MADPDKLIDRQTLLANYLVRGWPSLAIPGMSAAGAGAAVGNATQENNCKSTTIGLKDHGSDGLFQWRLDRLDNMKAFAAKWFTKIGDQEAWQDIEPQAAFFSFECKGDYKALWDDLVAGKKSLATLTANICSFYERPAAEFAMLDQRIKYATTFMQAWTPPVVPTPEPTPIPPVPVPIPVPVPTPTPIPPPTPIPIPPSNFIVVHTLAEAILASKNLADIRLLASAIVRELS